MKRKGHTDNYICSYATIEERIYLIPLWEREGGGRPSSYSTATGIPGVDHWALRTLRKEEAQVGGEVGGSEVVGGPPPPHHRLANPAGLLRRTPVSTQTPRRAGRTVHGKVRRNRRRS